ncbi:hypothetical protein ACCT04_36045, partial [Rhizobium ruizarguesonis]
PGSWSQIAAKVTGSTDDDIRVAAIDFLEMTQLPGVKILQLDFVDLQQIEGGTGAIAFELGALHIGIVDVALQPLAGGGLHLL